MSLERLQTVALIVGMLFLYFVIMPEQVDHIEDARIVPTTVPTIAIWVIIFAAGIQFFASKETLTFNPVICLRAVIYAAFILACIMVMKLFGFEYGAPILTLGVMLGIGERRLHWLFIGAVVLPIGVWLLVERVLDRILF